MTGPEALLTPKESFSAALRLLLHEVPAAQSLTRPQNQGRACVWCGGRAELAQLGGALGWRPAGCARCRPLRLRYVRAYLAWAGHVAACSACRGLRCATAEPLAFQHRVAYEGAGKRRPVICGCGCAVGVESPRLRPGTASLPGLCYSHTGACRAPERGWR